MNRSTWISIVVVAVAVGADHCVLTEQIHSAERAAVEEAGDVDSTELEELKARVDALEGKPPPVAPRHPRR